MTDRNTCPVPDCGETDPTTSIVVNNSKSFSGEENLFDPDQFTDFKGLYEMHLTFDVEFDGGAMSTVYICESCYDTRKHIKPEFRVKL